MGYLLAERGHVSVDIFYGRCTARKKAVIDLATSFLFLFFLTGIARDYNNVPVEFFKSVARPDMVRFSSILRKHRTEPERRQPL